MTPFSHAGKVWPFEKLNWTVSNKGVKGIAKREKEGQQHHCIIWWYKTEISSCNRALFHQFLCIFSVCKLIHSSIEAGHSAQSNIIIHMRLCKNLYRNMIYEGRNRSKVEGTISAFLGWFYIHLLLRLSKYKHMTFSVHFILLSINC